MGAAGVTGTRRDRALLLSFLHGLSGLVRYRPFAARSTRYAAWIFGECPLASRARRDARESRAWRATPSGHAGAPRPLPELLCLLAGWGELWGRIAVALEDGAESLLASRGCLSGCRGGSFVSGAAVSACSRGRARQFSRYWRPVSGTCRRRSLCARPCCLSARRLVKARRCLTRCDDFRRSSHPSSASTLLSARRPAAWTGWHSISRKCWRALGEARRLRTAVMRRHRALRTLQSTRCNLTLHSTIRGFRPRADRGDPA